jgi:ParB-like chromosome segregation protein Spo0J
MEKIAVSELKFAEYNPRQMPRAEMEKLKRSIREFGFVEPIVVNSSKDRANFIVGGHQRVRAAQELGMKDVPVVFVDLTEKKEKLLNLALNRIQGDWDEEKLRAIITEIARSDGADISISGFDEWEIKKILSEEEPTITELDESIPTANRCPKCGYEW